MKILDVNINWSIGFSNPPTLCVLIDKIPGSEEFIYNKFGF